MRIVRPKQNLHAFLTAFRELPQHRTLPTMRNMRGDFGAKLLLLAEHPTAWEQEQGAPFCDTSAQIFCRIIDQAGFNHEKDFLIMPFSRFGEKACKASTRDTLPFLQAHMPSQIRCIVCVGMECFSYVFAGGSKRHASTIIGNPMFIPHLRTLPVYVLPGSTPLAIQTDDWKLMQKVKEHAEKVFNLTLNLRKFLEGLNPPAI